MNARPGAHDRPTRTSPLRVVHVSKVKGIAGSEGHLLRLLPGLAARGLDVRMIELVEPGAGDGGFAAALGSQGVPVEQLVIRRHVDPRVPVALARRFRELHPDIVHTHLVHADLYGLRAARRASVPCAISSRHNTDLFRRRLACRILTRRTAAHADVVVAISHAVARFVTDVEGIDRRRVTTVHYGLDPQPDDRDARRAWRERFGIAPGAPLVGMVGRLVPQKGVDVLLEAFPMVAAAVPGARLVVAGDGAQRGALEAQTSRLGLNGAVAFTGWIERAQPFMSACDVVAVPSRYEGFGLVALEAMAARRPIVATSVDALPEIVEQGSTGLLVPPADASALAAALATTLSAPDRGAAMGEAGYARLLAHFTVDRMVEATMGVYRTVSGH
ncbi:MAG: glycosyltransferase family 4 protein [Vicinamibacteraceae bacterium]|nr:glycosyltransferase family 4 protein [Vicinamibacteraceae bacterium]